MQDHLTVYQVAEALGVSVDTIRRRIKANKLDAIQDEKGQWFVPMQAIELPMQENQTAYAMPMQEAVEDESVGLRQELANAKEELDSARRELAVAKEEIDKEKLTLLKELSDARTEAAVARAEVGRMENHIQDLREHNTKLTIALDQEQQLHQSLQKQLSLPAPEDNRSFWQRIFGRK